MRRVLIVATVGGFVTQFEQNNLDILRELGYEIGVVTPVDLFPRTGHVESVVRLSRK